MKPYYYVFRVGSRHPRIKHATLELAANESTRLASQHPGDEFEVLMCLAVTRTTTPATFWMEGVIGPHICAMHRAMDETCLVCGDSCPPPCSASSDALETPETDLEARLRSYRFCDALDANIYINAAHSKKLECQRNAAWKTLGEIRQLIMDDESIGATVEALFAKPLDEAEAENNAMRGAMARLCRAVSRRMMPDEPTPEDRMELREAFSAASELLHNAPAMASSDTQTPKENGQP